jgi:BlaI family transcriptional regulator, penicillinase repressor
VRFSEAEWRLMTALWVKSPASARDVHDAVAPDTGWAYTTVKTMLDRLVEKGALGVETPRHAASYTPLVSQKDGRRSAVRTLLDQAFGGSPAPLVAHLLNDQRLSKRDREEIARMLKGESSS